GELRALEYSQRLKDRSRSVIGDPDRSTGRVLFDSALSGGSQAAGRNSGEIAVGRLADLLALDGTVPDLSYRSGDALLDGFIFCGDDRMVSDVWSAGRHIVRDGRHVSHDELTGSYLSCMRRLLGEL
ncbi:MAG: formimidoylglutamate deiminase, partial [Rhodobacteraceae bacterium]|nr:formimidoylglutamate deiminase [Paracoccaceae bacterium]